MSKTLSSFITFKKKFDSSVELKPIRNLNEILNILIEDPSNFVSATKTKNYIMNDGLVDWLSINKRKDKVCNFQNVDRFTSHLMNQGNIFEDKIVEELINKFGSDIVKNVDTDVSNYFTEEKIKKTYEYIQNGIPIICSGILYHPEKKIFGIPDIIIRSDWINYICNFNYYDKNEDIYSAPRLRDTRSYKLPKYHYTIVDIKYTTLLLKSDGKHLLNSGFFPAYKSQIRVYLECLDYIQGYLPDKAFILGRKWKYSKKGNKYSGIDPFERLGCINYFSQDSSFIEKTKEAIEWIRLCNSPDAKNWSFLNHPLPHPQLYPNMSSKYEGIHLENKNSIADNIKELTSLWMVSVNNRRKAHTQGVYSFLDKRCNSKILGINGKKTSRILDEVIYINRSECEDLIRPYKIENNDMDWKNSLDAIYIDFETINDAMFDIKSVRESKDFNYIFMIGISYVEFEETKYISFKMKELNENEERRVCLEFVDFLENLDENYRQRLFVHWGSIERIEWEKRIEKYNLPSLKFLDLLDIFKKEPIVIKGCLNFKLKNISSKLKEYGFIKSTWNEDLQDGKDAMIMAFNYYSNNKDEMDIIENYNRIDVIVLKEILDFLRNLNLRKRKRSDNDNNKCKFNKLN